jgi:hypothetical protein
MVVVQFQRSTLPEERSVELNNLQAHAHFVMQQWYCGSTLHRFPRYDCVCRRRRGGGSSDMCAATPATARVALGRDQTNEMIHGGVGRDERRHKRAVVEDGMGIGSVEVTRA